VATPAPTTKDPSPTTSGYACEFCDKTFASSGSYHNHVMTAHKGRKFNCSYCSHSYSQKVSGLRMSMGTKTKVLFPSRVR
jgi:hypothetical protein